MGKVWSVKIDITCARGAEIDHAQMQISGAHARTCSSKWVRVIAHTVQNRGARR